MFTLRCSVWIPLSFLPYPRKSFCAREGTAEELSELIAAADYMPLDWEAVDKVLRETVTAESAVALRKRILELIDILSVRDTPPEDCV